MAKARKLEVNEKVYVVKNYCRHINYKQITDNWHDEFETPPPSKSSMFSLVNKFETRGTFPNRWIGRQGPIEWPARSPELTPPDFYLWGLLKNKVFAHKPRTIDELRQSISQECINIQPELCQKVVGSVMQRFHDCIQASRLTVISLSIYCILEINFL